MEQQSETTRVYAAIFHCLYLIIITFQDTLHNTILVLVLLSYNQGHAVTITYTASFLEPNPKCFNGE